MKKLFLLVLAAAALAGLAGGCGLLDMSDDVTVQLPEQEFAFDLDADVAKAQLQQYIETLDPPLNTLDLTNQTEIPTEVCYGGTCVDVPRIQRTLTISVPAQQVDYRNELALKDAIETGRVSKVNIDYIKYQITTNSLNFDLPALDLYLDDLNTTSIQADSDKIARVASIHAGATGEDAVQFTVEGRQIMSDYLIQDFAFAFMSQAEFNFDTNVTRSIPG
ncbi:MAG TPA: hypothetical protein P5076_14680, partial [Myxococcota bacterium]|nr:hypothetical protein [Myxococcota bacterium]